MYKWSQQYFGEEHWAQTSGPASKYAKAAHSHWHFLICSWTNSLYDFDGKVSVGGRKLCNIRFADDIDLIAGSVE